MSSIRDKRYGRAEFERYSEQMGYHDFEADTDLGHGYRNPNTNARWNFWVASRDAAALSAQPQEATPPLEPDGRMWSVGRAEFIRHAQQYEDARSADKASIIADVAGSEIWRAMHRAAQPQEASGCPACATCGQPWPDTCKRCGGTGVVDDGEITGIGGVPFENGPIKCVRDCPLCKAQAQPPSAQGEPNALKWCDHCGEGVTTFCRGKAAKESCPKFPEQRAEPYKRGMTLRECADAEEPAHRAEPQGLTAAAEILDSHCREIVMGAFKPEKIGAATQKALIRYHAAIAARASAGKEQTP